MQFLIVSSPLPARPTEIRQHQQAFWRWLDKLVDEGIATDRWRKAGRGAIVVLDVDSHNALHNILTQWSEYIPATFDIHALLTDSCFDGTHAPYISLAPDI